MKKLFTIILLVSMMFVCMYMPIVPYENTVKAGATTLRGMREELAKFEKEYKEAQDKENATNSEINQINQKIKNINIEITKIGDDIVVLNEEIKQLDSDILRKDEQIKQIANFIQLSNGESMYLQYAFGAKDFTDFIYRIAVSEQLSNYNQSLITEYKQMIEDNKNKQKELEAKEKELQQYQKSLSTELAKLKTDVSKIYETYADLNAAIKTQKEIIKLYEGMGCKEDEDVNVCSKTTKDTSFSRPLKSGWITSLYGMRLHPTLGYYRMHDGLDIGVGFNTAIYSPANGLVVAVEYKQSCGGNRVFIVHNVNGKKYTTLYQHLYKVNVKKGDYVTKQTVIGTVGGVSSYTPWDICSTGAHLHLGVLTGWAGTDYTVWSSKFYANFVDPRSVISFPGLGGYFGTR